MEEDSLPIEIGLAEAIYALQVELAHAIERQTGRHVRFELGPVELSVNVVATVSKGGIGEVKWWVTPTGGEGSRQQANTQVLKINLKPVLVDGSSSIDVLISGAEEEDPHNFHG